VPTIVNAIVIGIITIKSPHAKLNKKLDNDAVIYFGK